MHFVRSIGFTGAAVAMVLLVVGCEMPTDSPEEVKVRDEPNKPTFGRTKVENQDYVAGVAIPHLVLPRATGGDGALTYRLTPLPDGLSFDARDRTLSGVPASAGSQTVKYRVSDADGDAAELSFRISAEPLTKVYWTDSDGIHRVDVSGHGEAEAVLTSGAFVARALVDRTSETLYYSEHSAQRTSIKRASPDGSDERTVVTAKPPVLGAPSDFALDSSSDKIYWTDERGIMRASIDGSREEAVVAATGLGVPIGISLDLKNRKLYWTELVLTAAPNDPTTPDNEALSGGVIRRSNLDGSGQENVVTTTGVALEVDVSESNDKLYWSEADGSGSGRINRANLDGSEQESMIATTGHLPASLIFSLTGENVYYWDSGYVKRADLDGNGHEALFPARFVTSIVYAGNGAVLITENDLVRVVLADGSRQVIVESQERYFTGGGVALDVIKGHMYWAEVSEYTEVTDSDGTVYLERSGSAINSARLDGSAERTVVTTDGEVADIDLDTVERRLYWSEYDRSNNVGRIMSVSLDGAGHQEFTTTHLPHTMIEIDTVDRRLYWYDSDSGLLVIRSANLDGTDKRIVKLVTSTDGFAVDVVGRKLYYSDGSAVYRSNLDGNEEEVVAQVADLVSSTAEYYGFSLSAIDGAEETMYYVYDPHDSDGSAVIGRADLDGSGARIITTLDYLWVDTQLALGVR